MKVRVQQLNPIIGDLSANVTSIQEAIKQAEQEGAELLILPELVVSGYPPMDLLERVDFLEANYSANREIAESVEETAVIFGGITSNISSYGRKCHNSAILAHQGKIRQTVHKRLLPTYDVFDDLRYFEPGNDYECVTFKGVNLGITICEDIWYNENDIQYHTYQVNPAEKLVKAGADVIINISASPFTKSKSEGRQQMLRHHAEKLGVPVFYANQAGAHTELIFDGDSLVLDSSASIIARAQLFEEDKLDIAWNIEEDSLTNEGKGIVTVPPQTERIFRALVKGLGDYLDKTQLTDKVILGLSGGIDSALVACIATEALGSENVLAVTMPSEFSSEGSVTDSQKLADNLGIRLKELPVKSLYNKYLNILEPFFADTDFGVAEENIQSRIRGVLLMAISNKFGYMLLNTGNKSELATGYCTLYGDMAGGLGIISDLYKTEVYELSEWLNEYYYDKEVIPAAIFTKPPSAELRPDQKDSDTLPRYDILDAILEAYIEKQLSAKEIIERGFETETVHSVIKLVDNNEYKRFQAVPGLKISAKAFGTGRRWPLVQKWTPEQFR